jgi:hypothetical protein
MPWVVFEPTIPAFEWAKIVHALDRAATVIGIFVQEWKLKKMTNSDILRNVWSEVMVVYFVYVSWMGLWESENPHIG